jgi:ribosomal protein S12 methylthiotransferase accessory factor
MDPIKATFHIGDLFHPVGGLNFRSNWVRPHGDEPRFITKIVTLRTPFGRRQTPVAGQEPPSIQLSGSGTDLDEKGAERAAYGEALERLCSGSHKQEQFITATANELGGSALDLDAIPRCSDTELAHPACPLISPQKDQPIRWVRALSLMDGKTVFVPAMMSFLYLRYSHPAERIWLPISTGCAAHTSLEKAILSGILEIAERDAISITWLQKLALPRIDLDDIPPSLEPYWSELQSSARSIRPIFFDATNDLGLPTVYGVQVCSTVSHATTLVSCSTALDPAEAVAKVIRDMAHIRVAFRERHPVPERWDDFKDIFHGAAFMARAEQSNAFDFLLQSGATRKLSELSKAAMLWSGSIREKLAAVVERLRSMRLNAYVVELSTDEALRAGIRVVRVIIPGLQPLSLHYRARYLGHQRLYQCPEAMGYPVHAEADLNHWPQPFA